MNFRSKQLDSYSLLITSKYLHKTQDFINLICVCKKFKETTEKLRYNPIPIKSLKLFPKIQTQYLYSENDAQIKGIDNIDIRYDITYEYYLQLKQYNIKQHHINYIVDMRQQYPNSIPEGVNILKASSFINSILDELIIPNQITSIQTNCFSSCKNLKRVTLPFGLTSICKGCFFNCKSLSSISIPSSIQSIEADCFSFCDSLKTIDIPNSVKLIGNSCFLECSSLESVVLPPNIHMLDNQIFNGCCSLKEVKIPRALVSIGDYCFNYCEQLKEICLPSSLKRIGDRCFSYCGLLQIQLPESVESIGFNSFMGCQSLNNFKFESKNKVFPFKVSYNEYTLYEQYGIQCPNIILTKNDVINPSIKLKQYINDINCYVPNNVKELHSITFLNSRKIQSITIPNTVTSIGSKCFCFCSSLTLLSIPSSVKSIGMNCFKKCFKLNNLSVPLNTDNKYSFKISYTDYLLLKKCNINCDHVILDYDDYYDFNESIPTKINLTLDIKKATKETTIQNNIISIKSNYLSKDITTITIPINVTYLCDNCFQGYANLKSITFSTTLKYIGKHLIDNCISLTELNYEGDWNDIVVSYHDHLRYKSIGLLFNNIEYTKEDKIEYGNVIPSIIHSLHHSFYDVSNEMFHIPTHISSLDNHMFFSSNDISSQLMDVVIPTSIQTIPKYCFKSCYILTHVSLPSTLKVIKKKAFENCISLKSFNSPLSVISIEQYGFENCYSLTSITFITPLPKLENCCFKSCSLLKKTVHTIPSNCF